MEIILGLLIIAIGSFCQSSSYVPIKRVKDWSWESFWLVQGVFAWLVFPLLGALLAVPSGHSLMEAYSANPKDALLSILFGVLWGVGGLTFGLSMRYLGVALGQSISLGTCAALGTILTPLFMGTPGDLTMPVLIGVVVTLIGIAIIGIAGGMRSKMAGETVKEFNFGKGITVALIAGLMSACFSIGLGFGSSLCFEDTPEIYRTLPATFLVTLGGFVTNALYCLWQNHRNKTFGDYGKISLYVNNILFCALAGLLWYSQFFGARERFPCQFRNIVDILVVHTDVPERYLLQRMGHNSERVEGYHRQDQDSIGHRSCRIDRFIILTTINLN